MRLEISLFFLLFGDTYLKASGQDFFNYDATQGRDYGPPDWDEVSCTNNRVGECPGWPNFYPHSPGWSLNRNECRWCPIEGNKCGQHRQSPIDLQRDRAIEGHENEKECPDWHWIQYKDGSCDWEDMLGHFSIERHALQLHMPLRSNGDIDCVTGGGERKFPKLDYSKGFPDWWLLSRTDISVPSEHVQEGKRYDAEVVLGHFYEIDHYKNKLGKISIFMDAYDGEAAWPFLDKLICQWRKVEEEQRRHCGLPPAPVYKMCELYRGQVRTAADLHPDPDNVTPDFPTRAPLKWPDPIPIHDYGGDPNPNFFPLSMCEGDCDFDTDCADGLICYRRDAFEHVPGCLGGEKSSGTSDFCVFDPYGPGYVVPTEPPTHAPTITNRPTLPALAPRPLLGLGGNPPPEHLPLGLCHGDCDSDDDCKEGLYCFQRGAFEKVPGCIGGETDAEKTDYCILDPFGPGYDPEEPTATPTDLPTSDPTAQPSPFPTTSSPTDFPTQIPTPVVPTPLPSYYPRPVGPPKKAQIVGWNPDWLLGECEGDCDHDGECEPGLYCFQRNHVYQPIPGCRGGEFDGTLTDYCTYRQLPTSAPSVAPKVPTTAPAPEPTPNPTDKPTDNPTADPTAEPTSSPTTSEPTSSPTKPLAPLPAKNLGWTPPGLLHRCEGDCDKDSDCAGNLVCYQRNTIRQKIPGCTGGEQDSSLTDYCIVPADGPIVGEATPIPPVLVNPTSAPTAGPDGDISIINYGWSPPLIRRPLQKCAGDCDLDFDCAPGLVCFQRYLPYQAVPGCSGGDGDETLTDYCIPADALSASKNPPTDQPTEQPTDKPTDKTAAPTDKPSPFPTPKPYKEQQTANPTSVPVKDPVKESASTGGVPPPIDCKTYAGSNVKRMCKNNSCCENPRSSSDFCFEQYFIFGDDIESACYHCCKEEKGTPKLIGPDAPTNPNIPKTLGCDKLERPGRMCKANSCCSEKGAKSNWCRQQNLLHPDQLPSICWYCCFPSIEVDFDYKRRALAGNTTVDQTIAILSDELVHDESPQHHTFRNQTTASTSTVRRMLSKEEARQLYREETRHLTERDVETYVEGQKIIVREENFEPKGQDDEDAYFEEIYSAYNRRRAQAILNADENYDNVHYWPYEWLLKVGTEYYFRYEGTQTVPPCYDTAHWRVFKDPIRVPPHQIKELERLIAWRRNDKCEVDTAGHPRPGNPDAVDVNRPLQSFHKLHRKVFCECKDWPSKFQGDRDWCRNWRNRDPDVRMYGRPYNWNQAGF